MPGSVFQQALDDFHHLLHRLSPQEQADLLGHPSVRQVLRGTPPLLLGQISDEALQQRLHTFEVGAVQATLGLPTWAGDQPICSVRIDQPAAEGVALEISAGSLITEVLESIGQPLERRLHGQDVSTPDMPGRWRVTFPGVSVTLDMAIIQDLLQVLDQLALTVSAWQLGQERQLASLAFERTARGVVLCTLDAGPWLKAIREWDESGVAVLISEEEVLLLGPGGPGEREVRANVRAYRSQMHPLSGRLEVEWQFPDAHWCLRERTGKRPTLWSARFTFDRLRQLLPKLRWEDPPQDPFLTLPDGARYDSLAALKAGVVTLQHVAYGQRLSALPGSHTGLMRLLHLVLSHPDVRQRQDPYVLEKLSVRGEPDVMSAFEARLALLNGLTHPRLLDFDLPLRALVYLMRDAALTTALEATLLRRCEELAVLVDGVRDQLWHGRLITAFTPEPRWAR